MNPSTTAMDTKDPPTLAPSVPTQPRRVVVVVKKKTKTKGGKNKLMTMKRRQSHKTKFTTGKTNQKGASITTEIFYREGIRRLHTMMGGGRPPPNHPQAWEVDDISVNSSSNDDDDDNDRFLADLPNDTHLVIQSLQQESRGLFVPLQTAAGGPPLPPTHVPHVQVVLEYQILQRFSEHDRNVSETVSELHSLVRTHQLCPLVVYRGRPPLSTLGSPRRLAYLWACDYETAVRAAQQQYQLQQQQQQQQGQPVSNSIVTTDVPTMTCMNDDVTEWFLHHLSSWSGMSTISRLDFQQEWPPVVRMTAVASDTRDTSTTTSTETVDQAIQHLVSLQVLRKDDDSNSSVAVTRNQDDERYQLWLPGWGPTLKVWEEANHHILTRLARAPRKELSERTLMSAPYGASSSSSYAGISISLPFLLQGLEQEGAIQRVQRPSGRFVKRVSSCQ